MQAASGINFLEITQNIDFHSSPLPSLPVAFISFKLPQRILQSPKTSDAYMHYFPLDELDAR